MQRAQPPQTHIWGGLAPANSYMGGLGPCKLLHGSSGAAISYMGVLICFGPWELPCPPFPPRISRPGPAWTQGFCSQSVAVSCWAELATQPCFQAGLGGWMPSSNSVCGRRSQDTCGRDLRPSVWVRGRKEEGVCTCVREPMHVCVKHTSIGPWPHSVIPKPVYSRKCKRVYSDHGGGSGRWQWSLRKPCG